MQITFTIPDDKLSEFKESFLRIYPAPIDTNEYEWIKKCIKDLIYSVYEQGIQQKFYGENAPIYNENIIQVEFS